MKSTKPYILPRRAFVLGISFDLSEHVHLEEDEERTGIPAKDEQVLTIEALFWGIDIHIPRGKSKHVTEFGSRLTTDPTDPRLGHGVDETPRPQQEVYLVLSEEERAKGFIRPYRSKYVHKTCGTETIMGQALSETYARDPKFYGATYCVHCGMHRPVSEFYWSADGQDVGS